MYDFLKEGNICFNSFETSKVYEFTIWLTQWDTRTVHVEAIEDEDRRGSWEPLTLPQVVGLWVTSSFNSEPSLLQLQMWCFVPDFFFCSASQNPCFSVVLRELILKLFSFFSQFLKGWNDHFPVSVLLYQKISLTILVRIAKHLFRLH